MKLNWPADSKVMCVTMYEIHPDTRIGVVSLTVSELSRSLAFYQERIGLELHRRENDSAWLGVAGTDLLHLTGNPRAARPSNRTTGLYHFAILVPSRRHLAHSLLRLVETETPLQGFSDHLVSEAVYLADPDGNGIEIYRDRPRERWPRAAGKLQMATDPLDVDGLLQEAAGQQEPWTGLATGTTVGHIHLKVSRIDATERFYRDILGFSLVTRYGPSATFMSAGGYHHHIGANTWSGVDAPPPPVDSVGLRWYEILFPDNDSLAAVASRLEQASVPVENEGEAVWLADPSGNGVRLAVSNTASAIPAVRTSTMGRPLV